MFDSKDIARRALALAETKTAIKRKRIKIAVSVSSACAAFLFCLITVYTFQLMNIEPAGNDFGEEFIAMPDSRVPLDGLSNNPFGDDDEPYTGAAPVFVLPGDMVFASGNAEPGVKLTNPAENTCYLAFEIVLADTGETVYQSYLIAPGLELENIRLERELERGDYEAVLIIRAYNPANFAVIENKKADFKLTAG